MLKQVVHILTTVLERVKGCTQHLIGGGLLSVAAERERGGHNFTQSEIIMAALHVQVKPPDKQSLDHFIIRLCHLEE
jgi:hypothetical protein